MLDLTKPEFLVPSEYAEYHRRNGKRDAKLLRQRERHLCVFNEGDNWLPHGQNGTAWQEILVLWWTGEADMPWPPVSEEYKTIVFVSILPAATLLTSIVILVDSILRV